MGEGKLCGGSLVHIIYTHLKLMKVGREVQDKSMVALDPDTMHPQPWPVLSLALPFSYHCTCLRLPFAFFAVQYSHTMIRVSPPRSIAVLQHGGANYCRHLRLARPAAA